MMLNCETAAELIGISSRTLIRKAQQGHIPCYRRGTGERRRYFFKKIDVLKLKKAYQIGEPVAVPAV